MGYGISLDIDAQIGEITGRLDRVASLMEREQLRRPHPARAQTLLAPVASFTSQAQLTPIGDPPNGMVWSVERVTFGLTPNSTVTTQGTIIVYIGGTEVARTTIVPNYITFRGFQCYVTPGDTLNAVWVGGVMGVGNGLLVDVAASEFPVLGDVYAID